MFESIYSTITSNRQKSLGKHWVWVIDLVIDHTISISKYDPLAGSSYIKPPKDINHPKKGLINIENTDDNECFKWSTVRYLNLADRNTARIKKTDKEFAKKLDFKNINFPVKIRDHQRIEKNNFIDISVFGYENKEKHPIYL